MTPTETVAELLAGPVMSVADTGRVMRTSKSDVYNRYHSGELEGVLVGRRILIRTASVKKLLGLDDLQGGDAA